MINDTIDFGKDIACTDSLRPGVFATNLRLVAEACYRRLITPRGTLRGGEDEQNYGLDLVDLVGSVSTKADAAALPGRIQTELLKDERITSVDATITETKAGPAKAFAVAIEAQTDIGPFTLKLAVSSVTIDLLGLSVS
jgi:hypothetical protein